MSYSLVVAGSSLGGLIALRTVLKGLRPEFPLPIAIVQHRAESSGSAGPAGLAGMLQGHSPLPVKEPEDKEPILPGHVYVAPAGYHLLVEKPSRAAGSAGASSVGTFALTQDQPVQHARPSIDVLFESAAESVGSRAIGLILTAGSEDGVDGAVALKRRGGLLVVQDPATAESRVLPDAVLAATTADAVLPLRRIGPYLALTCDISASHRADSAQTGVAGTSADPLDPTPRLKRAS